MATVTRTSDLTAILSFAETKIWQICQIFVPVIDKLKKDKMYGS